MKNLFILLLLAPFFGHAQQIVVAKEYQCSNGWSIHPKDTIFFSNPSKENEFQHVYGKRDKAMTKNDSVEYIIADRLLKKISSSNEAYDCTITGKDASGNTWNVETEKAVLNREILCPFEFSLVPQHRVSRYSKDTVFTSVGYAIGVGQKIKLGAGSNVDGDFKFIRINSNSAFHYTSTTGDRRGANSANSAPSSIAGLQFKVVRVERRGTRNNGTTDYLIVNSLAGSLLRYEIDIERAVKFGEVELPKEYQSAPTASTTIIQQAPSVADELLKLKKLKDEGILTEDEFQEQKKKLLSK